MVRLVLTFGPKPTTFHEAIPISNYASLCTIFGLACVLENVKLLFHMAIWNSNSFSCRFELSVYLCQLCGCTWIRVYILWFGFIFPSLGILIISNGFNHGRLMFTVEDIIIIFHEAILISTYVWVHIGSGIILHCTV